MEALALTLVKDAAELWFGSSTVQAAIESALKWIAKEEDVSLRNKGILDDLENLGLKFLDADAHILLAMVQKLVGQEVIPHA
jgi:hypothetical protein